MDRNIYSKLTDPAKSALDDTVKEISDMILDKAYQKASLKNTAEKEISLRDIVEAREEILFKGNEIKKHENKRKRYMILLSMTGAAYSVFGLLFYLIQNKQFEAKKDLGLIIAMLGILISIISFYYSLLFTRRKVEIIKDNTIFEKDNSEFEIVRRWQVIEKLGTELMIKEGISDNRAKSFSFILDFLSQRLSDKTKIESLKRVLLMRNQIVHSGIKLTRVEIEEILKTADEIIYELENKTNGMRLTII